MNKILSYSIDYLLKFKYINKRIKFGFNTRIHKSNLIGRNIIHSGSRIIKSTVGEGTYIGSNCFFDRTKIGNYCSIASRISVVSGQHPLNKNVSTSPIFYGSQMFKVGYRKINKKIEFSEQKFADLESLYYVVIGNDVWIGEGVKVLQGVNIGDGAVIGAYSTVTKDIPPYSIYAGNPAKLIRKRFDEDTIKRLLEIEWWDLGYDFVNNNINLFNDVTKLVKYFDDLKVN